MADPCAEHRQGATSGSEGGFMRRRVNATGQTADHRDARMSELVTEFSGGLLAVMRGAAGTDHSDALAIPRRQVAFHIKQEGRIVDFPQVFRVVIVVHGKEVNLVGLDAAPFLGQIDLVFPVPQVGGKVRPDSLDTSQVCLTGAENALRRTQRLYQPPHPHRADPGQQVQCEVGLGPVHFAPAGRVKWR